MIFPSSYPATFAASPKPPTRLYMRGSFPPDSDHRYLCVIGSRTSSPYGRDVTRKLILGLRGYPVSIISGLANGIDSMAHEAALEAGLHCIGCPGSGLSWQNCGNYARMSLEKRIIRSGGAVISIWHPDHPSTKWTYPVRNKLMAAICDAVLIIEGGENSGTMGTAEAVHDLKKDIYVVPGSIYADQSKAPHMLLQMMSAKPVTSSEDILLSMGLQISGEDVLASKRFDSLDPLGQRIMRRIAFGALSVDELSLELGGDPVELQVKLTELELGGLISIDAGALKLV